MVSSSDNVLTVEDEILVCAVFIFHDYLATDFPVAPWPRFC